MFRGPGQTVLVIRSGVGRAVLQLRRTVLVIRSGPGLSEGPCVAGRWILFIGPRRTVLVIRSGVGRAELQPGRTALVIRSGGGRAVLQSGQTVLGEGEARSLGSQILRPWKGRSGLQVEKSARPSRLEVKS